MEPSLSRMGLLRFIVLGRPISRISAYHHYGPPWYAGFTHIYDGTYSAYPQQAASKAVETEAGKAAEVEAGATGTPAAQLQLVDNSAALAKDMEAPVVGAKRPSGSV